MPTITEAGPLGEPSYLTHLSTVLDEADMEGWRTLLAVKVLRNAAAYLPNSFVELGLDERIGEVRRGVAQHLDGQECAPALHVHFVEHRIEVGEIGRLADDDFGDRRIVAADALDVVVPIEVGACRAKFIAGRQVRS